MPPWAWMSSVRERVSGGGILSVTCGSFSKLQLLPLLQSPFLCWLSSMALTRDQASSFRPVLLAVTVRICDYFPCQPGCLTVKVGSPWISCPQHRGCVE